jgi:hypothetical protein
MSRLRFGLIALALSLGLSACAHARHTAVLVDATFAQAVFALDDARADACQKGVLTPAQCDASKPKMKQALIDVKALTESIQATPKNVAVPKNLPDLLTALTDVQAILGPSSQVPQAAGVSAKASAAIAQAIALLKQFTGGA